MSARGSIRQARKNPPKRSANEPDDDFDPPDWWHETLDQFADRVEATLAAEYQRDAIADATSGTDEINRRAW